jgi:hypothetical protein
LALISGTAQLSKFPLGESLDLFGTTVKPYFRSIHLAFRSKHFSIGAAVTLEALKETTTWILTKNLKVQLNADSNAKHA